MTMREKMARAILRVSEDYDCEWDDLTAIGQSNFLAAADAALAALEEPTEAMLCGARDWAVAKYGIGIGNDAADGCWRAMIGAAKADTKTPPD